MRQAVALVTTVLLVMTPGCAADRDANVIAPGRPSTSTLSPASVAERLRASGLTVQDAGMVEQPFFGVPARVFVVEGNDLQIYAFASSGAAESAAALVAPGGTSIGSTAVSWMAPPHFFRKDRLIVNYLGSSEKTLSVLGELFGPQFAGQ